MNEDSVELTIRAIDNASAVLQRVNTLLSKMIGAVVRLNRAFASMQAPAFSNMFNTRINNRIIQGLTAQEAALQRLHQRQMQAAGFAHSAALQRERIEARVTADAIRAAERRARAAEREAARIAAAHRRNWSMQAAISGFSSSGGAARAIGGLGGGGWTGMGGFGRSIGTLTNWTVNLANEINTKLWGAITRVFSMGINLATRLAQRLAMMGAIIGGIAAGSLTALGVKSLGVASQLQQAQISLNSMIGDTRTAGQFLGEMMEFARKTPYNFFEGMIDHIRRLIGVGFGLREVTGLMQDMGDAAAALGIGEPGLQGMVKAFSDIRAKGYIQAQEITRQFAEWGVPALRYIAEARGVSTGTAMKMIERREITGVEGIASIRGGMRRDFGGTMGLQFNTFQGRLNTLKETVNYAMAAIGDKAKFAITGIFAGLSETIWRLVTNGTMGKVGDWFASRFTPERVTRFLDNMAKGFVLISNVVKSIYTKVTELISYLSNGDLWVNVGNVIGSLGDYIVNMFKWAIGKLPGLAMIYVRTILAILPTVADIAVAIITSALTTLADHFKGWFIAIGTLLTTIGVMTGNPAIAAAGGIVAGAGLYAAIHGPQNRELAEWNIQRKMEELPAHLIRAGEQAFNYLAQDTTRPGMNLYGTPQTTQGQWLANQVAGMGAGVGNIQLPPWYNEMRNTFGEEFANGVTQAIIAGNTSQERAANAQLQATQEGNQTLSDMLRGEMFGGGDRLKRLSARFRMYQPGEIVGAGGGANININLSGGSSEDRSSVSDAMRLLARTLSPGSAVSINGRRGQ